MSKSVKLVFVVLMFVLVSVLVGCDGECATCVADPFAVKDASGNWVARATPVSTSESFINQTRNANAKLNSNVESAVNSLTAPVANSRVVIDSGNVLAGNTGNLGKSEIKSRLDTDSSASVKKEWRDDCSKKGGSVSEENGWLFCRK